MEQIIQDLPLLDRTKSLTFARFPADGVGRSATPEVGVLTYYLANVLQKMHKNTRIRIQGEGVRP